MDIKKFEINLKKINTLNQNIDLTGEDISKLEIELLKNYIKKMYEALAMDEEDWDEEDEIVLKKKKKKKKKQEEMEAKEEIEPVEKIEEKEVEHSATIEEQEIEVVDAPKEYDEVVLSIFDTSSSSELSDKLSSMPIADIKRAIGLNDRIFTINELFGGDKDLFNNTVEQLNMFESFDQARDYLLEHIAIKYNWAKEDNAKKAKRFVKVVKRRFSVS